MCFTSAFTYIADIVPKNRLNEGIGIFGIAGLTGLAIGPVVGEIIIQKFGFSSFFITAAGIGTVGSILPLPLSKSYIYVSDKPSISFFSIFIKRKIFIVAVLALLFGFGYAASVGFVFPFAKELRIEFISLYYICYSLAAVITRFFGGKLADKVGEDRVVPYALIFTGAGLISLIFLGGTIILLFSGLMTGCGHSLLFQCLYTLAIREEPINIRGKISGVFTGGMDAGLFLGSIILGYIGEWAGFRVLFFAAGFSLIIGLGIYQFRGSE
jgi:predicted MFS family arabinose efflux permease